MIYMEAACYSPTTSWVFATANRTLTALRGEQFIIIIKGYAESCAKIVVLVLITITDVFIVLAVFQVTWIKGSPIRAVFLGNSIETWTAGTLTSGAMSRIASACSRASIGK